VEYANLDHAASTPSLVSVKAAVDTALETYSSVHRGNGYASRVTSAWYEQARVEVAQFVGAREDDLVVFTRNTTDATNLLARTLPRGTEVFVFETEHHATLLPWQQARGVQVTTLPVPSSIEHALEDLETALAASGAKHRLVVVAGASNVTGELWPLADVVAVAQRHQARVLVDAAQLAPHRVIDIATSGIDYVVLLRPQAAVCAVRRRGAGRARDWLDAGAPYLRGGGATARVTTDGVAWATGGPPRGRQPQCHRRHRHRRRLCRDLLAPGGDRGARGRPGRVGCARPGRHPRGRHVVDLRRRPRLRAVLAFTIERFDSSLVWRSSRPSTASACATASSARTSSSTSCSRTRGAHPATAVRVSVGLANTAEHVDRLVAAVAELAANGPAPRATPGPTRAGSPTATSATWHSPSW
jgi:cysteine sulfinate desulfinase/cysteine desulfurase-like protein